MRSVSMKAFPVALAVLAAACSGASPAPSSNAEALNGPPIGVPSSKGSPNGIRDPQVIINALDAAGLALCHSDYNDLAGYNVYGILGAYSTRRFFPHHSALPIHSGNTDALSCITANQPDTGAIEMDVYPSPAVASAALRKVGHIWLASWLYGNVAVVVEQRMPLPLAQQVGEVLDHLSGAARLR